MRADSERPKKKWNDMRELSRSARVLILVCGCAVAGASLGLLFLGVFRYFDLATELTPILVLPSMLVLVRLLRPQITQWLHENRSPD